jgi:hypothetical protein
MKLKMTSFILLISIVLCSTVYATVPLSNISYNISCHSYGNRTILNDTTVLNLRIKNNIVCFQEQTKSGWTCLFGVSCEINAEVISELWRQ